MGKANTPPKTATTADLGASEISVKPATGDQPRGLTPTKHFSSWKERDRATARRPIGPDEVPILEALGHELRHLRERAGLSRKALGEASGRSDRFIRQIEAGTARTRLATLEALGRGLAGGNDQDAAAITATLVDLAGPTLVPPNRFSERREGNRQRREARAERLAAQALPVAEMIAEHLVADRLKGFRLVPIEPRNHRQSPTRGTPYRGDVGVD